MFYIHRYQKANGTLIEKSFSNYEEAKENWKRIQHEIEFDQNFNFYRRTNLIITKGVCHGSNEKEPKKQGK